MPSNHRQYVISEETRQRCHIFPLNDKNRNKFIPISLELFHYLYEVQDISFSIYFQVSEQMIEYIKASEFSHELVSKIIASRHREYENIEICVEKRHYAAFQQTIEKVRDKKIKALLSKDPSLDQKTLHLFSDLSNASQMIIKGGINRQVALEVQESASRLVDNLMESEIAIGTLSRMVLADPTLYDHSAAVAMISAVISKKILHKSRDQSQLIALGGLYHDVGKTCVPQHILNKPGKFSDEEFDVMKSHTHLGHDELMKAIEQGAPIENEVTIVALEHHEKFCGFGYPHGKAGRKEEQDNGIHEFARIVSIADVYSALLMKRVYKEAYEPEKALAIMESNADRDYDPLIFKPFVEDVSRSIAHYQSLDSQKDQDRSRIFLVDEKGAYRLKKSS
ncbi:MAG: HD-GYP domain-containing protein [Oligoflexus sp.]